ncbi:hypothetical protein COV11_04850 [Candidatus Woesearchaeota archaeon CG10_big_fil_rev_8_21_14_0_10_30_7]|nr:MAG: hypothetical protein COV11_04850 [Candidatus Woesearchaeota archaeon CG10_big_fil_rev_8_21_14_0_10_30_7]
MKNKLFKIIVLLFILIIVSCNNQTPGSSDFVGSKGLNFYFDINAPPTQLYEDSKFSARILVENVGVSDVDNAAYALGFEEQYVQFSKNTGLFSLFGKNLEHPYGDQTQVLLDGEIKNLGVQLEGLTTTLSFSVCYPYQTQSEVITCIDTNPMSKSKKSCQVSEHFLSGGQGAPIGVTKVVPRMVVTGKGVKPQYEITVKNLDLGEIISEDYVNSYCIGKSVPSDAYNVIDVEVFLHKTNNREKLSCTKKKLVLKDNSDTFFCEFEREIPKIEGTYPAPLIIKLNYGYAQTITKKVRIQSKN